MPYSLIKWLIVLASVAQDPVVMIDPVSDFLALDPGMAGRRGDIQEVFVVRADITGDGQQELFLSHQNFYIDRAGYGWYVYTLMIVSAFLLDHTRVVFMKHSFSIPFSKVLGLEGQTQNNE